MENYKIDNKKWKKKYLREKRRNKLILDQFKQMTRQLVKFADNMLEHCQVVEELLDGKCREITTKN